MNLSDMIALAAVVVAIGLPVAQGFFSWRVTAAKIEAANAAADKRLAEKLAEIEADRKAWKADIENLHSRINDVRESFVRREDFREHMAKVEKTLDAIAASQVKTQEAFTQLLIELRTSHPAK